MERKSNVRRTIWSVCRSFDVAFFIFILFTVPALVSKGGISFNFVDCFYTNGLFEKQGIAFFRAFLFELPMAIVRWTGKTGMLPLVLIALICGIIDIRKKNACIFH